MFIRYQGNLFLEIKDIVDWNGAKMLVEIVLFFLIMIVLYLLIIMPKLKANPQLEKFDGWLYAHRGLHDNKTRAPENSLAAFSLAVEKGFGIELDVQVTKDLVPVVHHDYKLKRSCKVNKKISELTYQELRKYKIFGSEEKIPTLEEVLETVDKKVPLIIELKIPWKPNHTCEAVSKVLANYQGLYCIESFNPFGLIWYKKHFPHVVRGQLSTDFIKEKIKGSKVQYFILKHLLLNFLTKPDFIAYHHVYRRGLSFTICRKLYRTKTFAWTIESQEQLEDNQGYFDLFIFDSFIPEKK
jgi:glycerophosphoryl diester phosphodiesterase